MAVTFSKWKTPIKEQDPEVRKSNFGEVCLGYTLEEGMTEAGRCLQCKTKPCVAGCPVKIDIPAFIKCIKEGDMAGAAAVMETDARNTDFHQRGHPPLELWKRTVDSVQRFDCLAGCFCKINLNAVHLRLSCFIQGQSDYVVPPGQYGYGHHPGVLGCEVEYEVPSTACELRCATWPSKNPILALPPCLVMMRILRLS